MPDIQHALPDNPACRISGPSLQITLSKCLKKEKNDFDKKITDMSNMSLKGLLRMLGSFPSLKIGLEALLTGKGCWCYYWLVPTFIMIIPANFAGQQFLSKKRPVILGVITC